MEQGASVNHRTRDKFAALFFAATKGDLEMVKLLVERGANVHDRLVILFIETIPNPNTYCHRDEFGNTPLLLAAKSPYDRDERIKILEYLVAQGASLSARNNFGRTALVRAAMGNSQTRVDFFLSKGNLKSNFHF